MEFFTTVESFLAIAFGGALLTFLLGYIHSSLRNIAALIVTTVSGVQLFFLGNAQFQIHVASFDLAWGMTSYSFIFAILVALLSVFTVLYSFSYMHGKDRLGYYYFHLILTIAAMYGILFSLDMLSLFIFWEIMTWSSFMLTIYKSGTANKAGIKYFVYSAAGAYAILFAIVVLHTQIGSLYINDVSRNFLLLPLPLQLGLAAALLFGFGVKAGLMPMHGWAPDAYAESPSPFTALFSGALSKMGIFGMGLVLFPIFHSPDAPIVREIIAWLGGLTAAFATLRAIQQTDAKKLLAYSSVGQMGYVIMGLAVGTSLSVMAGLFIAILHGVFKGMLFFAIGAVIYRTGLSDLNQLRGLIRRMPVSFFTVLMGIITVANIPPLGGFVGKWMLYEALIQSDHYFLVIVAFFASTASFLYVYRLIFSIFLGQEEKEFEHVKEAPFFTMQLPMLLLSAITIVTGVFPGLLLQPIAAAMDFLGFPAADYWQASVLFNEWGDKVNLLAVISSIATVFLFGLAYISIFNFRRTRYASTKDIHTSGEIPTENENLTYAIDFFQPFERAAEPALKHSIRKAFDSFARGVSEFGDFLRHIYTGDGQTYAWYVVLFLVVMFVLSGWIF